MVPADPPPACVHALRRAGAALAALLLCACQSGGGGAGPADPASAAGPAGAPGPRFGDERQIRPLTGEERRAFEVAWRHFLTHSSVWELYRDEWLERGGPAPYVLAENLFGHFFRTVLTNRRAELPRIAETAHAIGEPAVAYFAKALATDAWPLKKPVTAEVMDPDDLNARIKKTFRKFVMDDETRRWTAGVLAEIGAPAVPTLASPAILRRAHPTSRRYAAFALGRIGTPEAVEALSAMLRDGRTWEDRAAAATALGLVAERDPRARAVLLRAADADPDAFVRRKANRALASADRVRFW